MLRIFAAPSILLAALLVAPPAQGQFVCPTQLCADSGDPGDACYETKYGLSQPDSLLKETDPLEAERIAAGIPTLTEVGLDEFAGSMGWRRDSGIPQNCDPTNPNPAICGCGAERDYLMLLGTIILQELNGCDPFDDTSTGWGILGGPGCPVSTGHTTLDADGFSAHFVGDPRTSSQNISGPAGLPGFDFHAALTSGGNAFCARGRRVPNPDPNAGATETVVVFDDFGSPGLPGFVCCNSPDAPNICATFAGVGVDRYPLFSDFGSPNPYNNMPPFVFEGGDGPGALNPFGNFEADPNFITPGQRYGVCENSRTVPCDCGVGSACLGAQIVTADNPCPNLDADPGTGGVQPDRCLLNDYVCEANPGTSCSCEGYSCFAAQADVCAAFCPDSTTACGDDADCGGAAGSCSVLNDSSCSNPCPGLGERCDLRSFGGWALATTAQLADGSPDPNICPSSAHRYRGFVNNHCSLFRNYDFLNAAGTAAPGSDRSAWGDPGPDCAVPNFGGTIRPDFDCNGIDDTTEGANPTGDLCPFYTETNLTGDTNGNGRGDSCECGDATRDGVVNIADILLANSWIFVHPGGDPGCTLGTPGCTTYRTEPGLSAGYARLWLPLADTGNDPPEGSAAPPPDPGNPQSNPFWDTGGTINIADILDMNSNIFGSLGQPSCARYPICGDGALDPGNVPNPGNGAASGPGEQCDDGNTAQGDGCDNNCQVEPTWACDQAEPSACVQL